MAIVRRLALLVAAFALVGTAHAASPESVTADYNVYRDSLHVATVHEVYSRSADTYRITSETTPVGIAAVFLRKITVSSNGSLSSQGLKPDYLEYRRANDPGKNISAAFDWRAQRLNMTFEGRNETAPLVPGIQDRLSVMYQFMFLSPEKLKVLEFPMTNGRKIEHYRYELADVQAVDSALGKLETLHLVKHREAGENGIDVWLAADRHLFPVKVVFRENDGSTIEQVITRLEVK